MELYIAMFTLGLVTSLHCVSMCGPMVVTYALRGDDEGPIVRRLAPNAAYQVAKILSYMTVGLLLGAAGAAIDFASLRPYVMLGAGLFMVLLGLSMTGRFPWLHRLTPKPPRFLVRALSSTRRKAKSDAAHDRSSLSTPVTFGLLTGLMPCAPLMAAQLNAAASGGAVTGALAMAAFGLGTAPLMLGFGTASSLVPARLKERAMALLAIVVVVFGLVYLNRGAMLVGSPVTFDSVRTAVLGGPEPVGGEYAVAEDGVVEIPLTVEDVRFVPSALELPEGQPVRLVVDRREDNACSDQLAIPQLGVLADLTPFGTTIVEVPSAEAGSYTLTCGMGMMSGSIAVGDAPGGVSPLVYLGLAVVGAGAFAVMRRRRGSQIRESGPARPAEGPDRRSDGVPGSVLGMSPVQVLGIVGVAAAFVVIVVVASSGPAVGAAGASVAGAVGGSYADEASTACACCDTGGGESVEGAAAVGPDGVQRIDVDVASGFSPNVVRLAAGTPTEITFGEGSGCMAQVMSEELGFFEDLQSGPKTVSLPALEPGTYGFSCGMRMVFGEIVVE